MLIAIHHVAIICSNYDLSKRFYAEILRLPVLREIYRSDRDSWKCDLMVGDTQIELFSFSDPPTRPSCPEACGLRHLAFEVASLDAVIDQLQAAGVLVESIRVDPYTGKRFTFFTDPDGLPLELYEG